MSTLMLAREKAADRKYKTGKGVDRISFSLYNEQCS